MRNLLDPDELMSPGLVKSATRWLSILLAVIAGFMLLMALFSLFSWNLTSAFTQAAFGLAIPLSIWLVVRLLSDMVASQHRLNDRLGIIADHLTENRSPVVEAAPPTTPVSTDTLTPKAKADTASAKAKADDVVTEDDAPKPKRRRRKAEDTMSDED